MNSLPDHHYYEIPEWVFQFQWLAIVGSTKFVNPGWQSVAETLIYDAIDRLDVSNRTMGVTSGGAKGIDALGETVSDDCWFRKVIYPPKNNRWEPEGFKERNLLVATTATWGLGIRCESSKTFGTGFTIQQIENQGKEVERYVIHERTGCTGCRTDASWRANCSN